MHRPAETKTRGRAAGVALAAAFLAALITLIVYLPSLKYGFVTWDDPAYVYKNLYIRSIDPGFIKLVFTTWTVGNWHPLTMISLAIDYSVWGVNPVGYHLTNIVFHAANTFLVGMIATRLVRSGGGALRGNGVVLATLVAALLFGLHPLHVESVAWVSERKDVLFAFFFFLSILAYLGYVSAPRSRGYYYVASLVAFAFSLMSKPMAVTLPAVLLVLDFYPLERLFDSEGPSLKSVVLEKIPFFVLSAASAALTLSAQTSSGAVAFVKEVPLAARFSVAIRGFIFYLYKMAAPLKLAPLYPLPYKSEVFSSWFWASLLIFIAITLFCAIMVKRKRIFLAVWLFYVITLSPVIGIIQVGTQAAADRYTYLPSLGPFMLASVGAGYLLTTLSDTKARLIVSVAIGIAIAVLAGMTLKQESIWKDSFTLWNYEIRLYGDDAPLAYNQRGVAYKEAGNVDKAVADFNRSIMLDPDEPKPYKNLSKLYEELGDYARALEYYKRAEVLERR